MIKKTYTNKIMFTDFNSLLNFLKIDVYTKLLPIKIVSNSSNRILEELRREKGIPLNKNNNTKSN